MARILIVEDEPIGAEVAEVICRAAGHVVAVAGNGLEALHVLARERFDLILADVLMPEMDGLSLARALRAEPQLAWLPVIGVTAHARERERAEMNLAGIRWVVTKPYRARTLREAIDAALGRPHECVQPA